jgi:thioredoxin reductase (NADPH)
MEEYDVLIIGGGPAGLCAAINGSSEGLRVALLDSADVLGGQALASYSIENYPMPSGIDNITGARLMAGFVDQALAFGTRIINPCRAVRLSMDGEGPWKIVITDDFQELRAKCIIISTGLSWRRLNARGIEKFMGRGVYYGVPGSIRRYKGAIGVVGGANSAGQAVLQLARYATTAYIIARSPLAKSMSTYLIERIRTTANIAIIENATVVECLGNKNLTSVDLMIDGAKEDTSVTLEKLFIYIGAIPHTAWLHGTVELNKNRFILTDADLPSFRNLHPCETSMRGVFAAGDVRYGQAVKRITGAIGDGITALQSCHRFCSDTEW